MEKETNANFSITIFFGDESRLPGNMIDDPGNITDDLPTREFKYEINLTVPHFSNVEIHQPNACSTWVFALVYPNGYDGGDSKNQVSLKLFPEPIFQTRKRGYLQALEAKCILNVIDVNNVKRHPRSFTFVYDFSERDKQKDFVIRNYISRDALMEDSSELLPNDTLTLNLAVTWRERLTRDGFPSFTKTLENFILERYQDENGVIAMNYWLDLDSALARRLAEETDYFRIIRTDWMESKTRRIKVSYEEHIGFLIIYRILFNYNEISSELKFIILAYKMADMYNIPAVIDTCRCWLVLCLSDETVPEISELAEELNDTYLKEAVEIFVEKDVKETEVGSHIPSAGNSHEAWIRIHHENKEEYYFKRMTDFAMGATSDVYI